MSTGALRDLVYAREHLLHHGLLVLLGHLLVFPGLRQAALHHDGREQVHQSDRNDHEEREKVERQVPTQ